MKGKKILIIILSLCMIISTIIPIFAVNNYINSISSVPNDLANLVTNNILNTSMTKYYLVINLDEYVDAGKPEVFLNFYCIRENGSPTIREMQFIEYSTSVSVALSPNSWYYADTVIMYPHAEIYFNVDYPTQIYVPIYFYNSYVTKQSLPSYIKLYSTTPVSETILWQQAYQLGYDSGLSYGLESASGIQSNLNIVEHIEQLIGQFTGDEFAQYITPIALVLTILLIYFLFIRWLLSMIKAKGVLKVCDIIVLVACISILIVLYFPMIDITTTQHQIIENIYSVTSDITP